MATAKFSKTVTSGVCEELHECEWVIKNWDLVQVDESLVKEQQFELQTGCRNSLLCKFQVGLDVSPADGNGQRFVGTYCKLLELSGNISPKNVVKTDIPVSFGVCVKNPNGGDFWAPASISKSMKVQELIEHKNGFDFNLSPNPKAVEYLVDGSLPIYVTLRVLNPITVPQTVTSAMNHFQTKSLERMTSCFGDLLKHPGKTADVILVSSDKERFKCHKVILSARNEKLRELLQSNCSERNPVTHELPISGKALKVLLHYIYTGQLLDSWSNPDVIVEFTKAAGEYCLTDVLEMLDKLLGHEKQDTSMTSFLLLQLATELNLVDAQTQLMERIVNFTMAASTSTDLLQLIEKTNVMPHQEPGLSSKQLPEKENIISTETDLPSDVSATEADPATVEAAA